MKLSLKTRTNDVRMELCTFGKELVIYFSEKLSVE